MHHRPQHLQQLCVLMDESLHPFTEEFVVSLTKEREKDLLILLSQIFRQIHLWTHEFDSHSNNVAIWNTKCSGGSKPHCEDHDDCLTKIIGDLIPLLPIESQYVQHLAGNILVAISDYMVAYGLNWNEFMHSLVVCLELTISNALLHSLERPTKKAQISNYDSSCVVVLKPKLKNANWSSVVCVIRVLRNILKHLKKDVDGQLLEVYLASISSCLANVPWDSMDELLVGQNAEALRISSADAFHTTAARLDLRLMFPGTLVQFFCSLVNQSGWMEVAGGSSNNNPVIFEIRNLFPRLLAWCLDDGDGNNMGMSEYFIHKMLMLMVRLSFQIHLECSLLVSWLQLIHKYFKDLLLLPITQLESDQEDSLEGSPFLVSISDGRIHNMTSSHLQRLAVFLFLRCSLSLVGMRDRNGEHCGCANLKTSMNSDLNSDLECCSRKKGLSELYGWLQRHLPAEMLECYEFYSERCTSFSLSFLRLFIHEDDILFEVLLQLFCVPFCAKRQVCQDRCGFQAVKDDMLFHVSNLFNPIHLFHLFLAELHYDHQVLLDYLISKDTGASSAEYLLRSLRIVCDSWNVFVEFSEEGKVTSMRDIYKSSGKKRKVLVDCSDIQGHLTSSSAKNSGIPLSLGNQCQKDLMYGSKHCRTDRLPFVNARDCLLSLKNSLQNLHKKKLFPYNPKVLLQRLTRFQELCLKQ